MSAFDNARLRRQRNWAYGIAAACLIGFGVELAMHRQSEATISHEPLPSQLDRVQETPAPPHPDTTTEIRRVDPNSSIPSARLDQASPVDEAPVAVPSLPDAAKADRDMEQSPVDGFFDETHWKETPDALNDRFRLEQREDEWASATETSIDDFVARHPFAHAYENLSIECRASLCQVYAEIEPSMATAIQQSSAGIMDPFSTMTFESLGNDLEAASAAFGTADSDRLSMVITLRRRE